MSTLIIVNGDDDFLKERVVLDEIGISLSLNVNHFKLPEDAEKYEEFLDMSPFDPSDQTTVVWGAVDVPKISNDGVTILVAAKGKAIQCNKAKRTLDAKKPKPYSDGIEYTRWILREGERFNIDLKRVASALFVNCGTDLRKICSEINKLRVVAATDGSVDPSVARRVMCFSAELTPKYVIDAICDGNTSKALVFYDKLQECGDETGWVLAYLQRHVLQQLRSELLMKRGDSPEQVASALGVQPSLYRNIIAPRMGLWSIHSLLESFEILCDLDIRHKHGGDMSRWGLEHEMIRLSEEAKHNVTHR